MPLELIVFVGIQGAGKSTYYRAHLAATHVHVSKDLMPNARNRDATQAEMITRALTAGRSVAVDNTNPTPAVRAPLIELGKALGARVVAYYFETPAKEAAARNRLREGKARVPDAVVFITARKVVPPSVGEGFDEVRVIAHLPENA